MITRNRCSSLQWILNALLLVISIGLAVSTGIFVRRYNILQSGYLGQISNSEKNQMSIKLNAKLSNGQTLTKIIRIQAVNSSQRIDKVLKHSISQCSISQCSIPDNVITIQSDGSLHIEEFSKSQIRRKSSDGQLQSSWGFEFTPTSVVIDAPLQGNQAIEVKKEILTDKTATFSPPSASKYVLQIDGDVNNTDDSPIVNITGNVTAKQGIYIGKNLNVEDGTAINIAGNIYAKNGTGLYIGGNLISTKRESIIINGTVELDSDVAQSYAIRIGKIYSENSAGIYVQDGINTSTTAFHCDKGITITRDQATAIILGKEGITSGGHGINISGNITSKRGPAIIVDGNITSEAFTDIHKIWINNTNPTTKENVEAEQQEKINISNSKIESGVILIKGNVNLNGNISKQTTIHWYEHGYGHQEAYNISSYNSSLNTTNAVYIHGDVNGGIHLKKLNSSKEGITVAGGITSAETSININGPINSTQGNGLQISDGNITASGHGIFVNGSINSTKGDGIQIYNGNITASEHGIHLNSTIKEPNGKPKKNDCMIYSYNKSAIYVEGVIMSNKSNAVSAHGLIAGKDGLNLRHDRSIYNTPITVTTEADKSEKYAIDAKQHAIAISGIVKSVEDAIAITGAEAKRTAHNGKYYQIGDQQEECNDPDSGRSTTYEWLQNYYDDRLEECKEDVNPTQCVKQYEDPLKNLYELFGTSESRKYSLISTEGRGIYINNGLLKSSLTGVTIEPTGVPSFTNSYESEGIIKTYPNYGRVCVYHNTLTYAYNSIDVSEGQHYNFAETTSGEKCEWYNDDSWNDYIGQKDSYDLLKKTCSAQNANVVFWCSGEDIDICVDETADPTAIICKTKEEWFSDDKKKQKYDQIIDMLQKCSETGETPITPTSTQ